MSSVQGLDQIPAGVAAAVSGGVVGALIVRGSMIDRVSAGVTGAALSWFAGPVVAPFIYASLELVDKALFNDTVSLSPASVHSFAGFLLGTTGLMVPSALHALGDAVRRRMTTRIGKL